MGSARQCGFEREVLLAGDTGFNLAQKQTAGRYQLAFRCQRRQPGRDQVRIDEVPAIGHLGQVFQGRRGFYPRSWGRR